MPVPLATIRALGCRAMCGYLASPQRMQSGMIVLGGRVGASEIGETLLAGGEHSVGAAEGHHRHALLVDEAAQHSSTRGSWAASASG